MKDKLLYTTKELFDSYLNGRHYTIPEYQRGYKWEIKDVERLLKDVDSFNKNDDLDLFYCLQNITLVEKENSFNVVDGQQRLTTLTVILSYLDEYSLISEKIEYKIREQTKDFLDNYIYKSSNIKEINKWEELLEIAKSDNKDYDYQDIYYLFNSYKAVQEWFKNNLNKKEEMKDKILNHIKIIVNLPKNIDEQELFENLNGKRVPLDGADLIRALIITRVAKTEVGEMSDNIKQNVLINEKRIKIGLLLDTINLWWADENRQTYFHYFTKESKISDSTWIVFNEKVSPINNLYKLYSLVYGDGKLNMEFFEQKSTDKDFLHSLQTLQRTLENWYNDRELYHLILFTMIYASEGNKEYCLNRLTFKELFNEWKGTNRRDFIKNLKKRIACNGNFIELRNQSSQSEVENENKAFEENLYDNKDNNLVAVSVFLDIINILESKINTKLPAIYFKACEEDFEHIFPQTPIGDRVKDKDKQTQILEQYIEIINNNIKEDKKIKLDKNDIDWDNEEWKENIKKDITEKIGNIIPINSLGNMCLLHKSVNRGYGNDFFLEKRIDIMRKSQQGYFIRSHVYDAFNKIFIERQGKFIDMSMMTRWDKSDILGRRKYIIDKISNFLK